MQQACFALFEHCLVFNEKFDLNLTGIHFKEAKLASLLPTPVLTLYLMLHFYIKTSPNEPQNAVNKAVNDINNK